MTSTGVEAIALPKLAIKLDLQQRNKRMSIFEEKITCAKMIAKKPDSHKVVVNGVSYGHFQVRLAEVIHWKLNCGNNSCSLCSWSNPLKKQWW